ncbi:MAG: hypothetical protein A3G27_15035 [Betaproteobacteria bacterium RIFCSPLOWO2_12_FULL_66_14]|nr:MAG: hypothetical protein A3G27_15035 [Betaproteobacteria bacterium RIFCSPLOWO2_12_FULL_66_14]
MSRLRRLVVGSRRWRWRLVLAGRRRVGMKRTRYVEERTEEYRGYWERAASSLSATLLPLFDGVWEVRQGGRRTRVSNHMVQIDDPVTLRVAGNKLYCYETASRLGVPVPRHCAFRLDRIDAAWEFMAQRGGVYAVKPASRTSSAVGITTLVRTRRELESAAALASLYCNELLVEAMVPAESCRLLFLAGELIHAVRRRGVRLVGDGRSSVAELLAAQGLGHLQSDLATVLALQGQGLSEHSRVEAAREFVARYLPAEQRVTEELRTVYNECITALICPELARSIACVVRDIGSRFAGVDILTNDPSVPLAESRGVFLELNTTPGIHHHYIGSESGSRPVAVAVLRYLLEHAQMTREDATGHELISEGLSP